MPPIDLEGCTTPENVMASSNIVRKHKESISQKNMGHGVATMFQTMFPANMTPYGALQLAGFPVPAMNGYQHTGAQAFNPGDISGKAIFHYFGHAAEGGCWPPAAMGSMELREMTIGHRGPHEIMHEKNAEEFVSGQHGFPGYYQPMVQYPVLMSGPPGSYQDLLKNVCSLNKSLQYDHHTNKKVVTGLTEHQAGAQPEHNCDVNDDSHLNGLTVDDHSADENCGVDGQGNSEADDEESDGVGEQDSENLQDTVDEDSDASNGNDVGLEPLNEGSVNANDTDASYEYEIVQVPNNPPGHVKKRLRLPKGEKVPDFRPPRAIGNIDKAMWNARHGQSEGHIFEPKIGMVFDCRAEIYNFYNLYSWEVGFGIRYGTFGQNTVNKKRTMQELVCEKEGFDPRCKNNSKRMNCPAKLRLHRTEDLGWYVSEHVTEHNHPLSVSYGEKREWRSHGIIEDGTKRMIRSLRENNVAVTKVHCIVGSLYGRMEDVPFNKKSLKAVCTQISKEHKVDDISKTLEIFRKMRAADPGFQFSVDLDEDKKVKTLLWTSGRSRSQYNFFGDAITFDTTYCTNIYKMPFGMFVGVNNHFQSILFAGVLMVREDTSSFNWVFTEFIAMMGGKFPQTILTDQCKAMKKAIKEVFPAWTVHLWCKWHVLRYAPEELGPVYRRNGPFRRDFHYVINQMLTVDEFERAWQYLLDEYDLHESEFMKRTYAKRHKWAKPWSKEIFCARMATTQRSESANSILKKVVPRNSSMNRFVEQYNKLLFLRLRAEQKAEHQTKQFVHRTKRMYALEKHAITVYTKNGFQLFSEEVDKSTEYDVEDGLEENTFTVIHSNAETRKHWARVVFTVQVAGDKSKFTCECGNYDHFGMLCCHAIKVMMHCGVKKIPEAHIMKRWTRTACDYKYTHDSCSTGGPTGGQELGQTLLYANALDLVNSTFLAPKAGEILNRYLNMARKEIDGLDIENAKELSGTDGDNRNGYISASGNEKDMMNESGYDSDGQPIVRNNYGAAASSAYLSDADISTIQAPSVTPEIGRKREKRYKPIFERARKGKKRYTANRVIWEHSNYEGGVGDRIFSKSIEGLEKKKKKLAIN